MILFGQKNIRSVVSTRFVRSNEIYYNERKVNLVKVVIVYDNGDNDEG